MYSIVQYNVILTFILKKKVKKKREGGYNQKDLNPKHCMFEFTNPGRNE